MIRLRLRDERTLLVPAFPPHPSGPASIVVAAPPPAVTELAPPEPPAEQNRPEGFTLHARPLIALIEAVAAGADSLAATLIDSLAAQGYRTGVVSLEPQNRLAARLGCTAAAPPAWWQEAAGDLFIQQGPRVVVPAPAAEADLAPAQIETVLEHLCGCADGVVVDLGCRWNPRLFRPVLTRATHIWLLVRAGQWSAVEMRLEQAEFSGWTDMGRLRVIVVGDSARVPAELAAEVLAVLPDTHGPAVRTMLIRELGGWSG